MKLSGESQEAFRKLAGSSQETLSSGRSQEPLVRLSRRSQESLSDSCQGAVRRPSEAIWPSQASLQQLYEASGCIIDIDVSA